MKKTYKEAIKDSIKDENKKNIEALKKKEESLEELSFDDLKDGFHKDIIYFFELISKPFDDGKGEKEKIMLDILKDHGAFYEEKIGIRVPAKTEKPDIVVVSHMDLISSFNRGFQKGRVYSLAKIKNKEVIIGALDNTITNAVVLLSLLELREKGLAQNVEFLFTEGEEIDLLGMKSYLKKYGNEPFFINLDVTNDNQDFHASIEYDQPNWSICRQISKAKSFTFGFTKDRVCDDMDAVIDAKGKGFSYCLPTWKTIHSYKNYTLIDNLVPYFEGLKFLISSLDVSDRDCDFKYISIKKALECNSKDKLEKKDKKAKKKQDKRRPSYSNYHGRTHSYSYSSSASWDKTNYHRVSENDFEIHEDYAVDNFGQGRIFYDYGDDVLTESQMLKRFAGHYDDIDSEDLGLISSNDIYDLEEVIKTAIVSAEDYEVEVDEYLRTFISEKVMSRRQWTIDDLAGKLSSIEKASILIEAWDDYYVLDKIEPGVYQFKSSTICAT